MRMSPLSSAMAAPLPSSASAIVSAGRESLIVPVLCLSCCCLVASRASGARAWQKFVAGVGEFVFEALHQLGNRRRVGDLADALAGAPDVTPRLGFHVAAG